ncbi:endonuclease domain-containing protein [Planctomycetales bacterium ZRK34]|nr:endonuclease domain-containing protein [Planctomycetales bacterium ZRK34]
MTQRARDLRKDSPTPERILWGYLRNRQLGGLKFRRQVPIDRYVADYYCADAKLIIELDGESHVGRAEYDERRTQVLESRGYRVLRFMNDDLLNHPEAVADAILRAAEDAEINTTSPSPQPSPCQGEGVRGARDG